MIRHLIWDVGGTLFDTYPAVVGAAQSALEEAGRSASTDTLKALFRHSTRHALETLAARLGLPEVELSERFRLAYERIPPHAQPYFDGVPELCRLARARGGANFIVTHRQRASVLALLDAHGLGAEFSDIIAKEDPFPRKPDPTSLLALLGRHQLSAPECLMIGDRPIDVQAAQSAGLWACLRVDDVDDARLLDFQGASADLVVRDYSELYRHLVTPAEAS